MRILARRCVGHAATRTKRSEDLPMPLSDDIPDPEQALAIDGHASGANSRMRSYIAASALLICLIGWTLH
jgi:hypothetical protein